MAEINIQYYKANYLIMAEYNPRQLTKDQYTQLKDSLTRFGLVDPLIVNKHKTRKNILVGGHQRLRIAKEMGLDNFPCVEVDLPYDKERELNIRLNKNVGEWDYDSLANHFDVGELTEWGFSDDELQFWIDEPTEGLIEDDEIPEVELAITKQGDLWMLGDHKVLCGDATKKEDVERLMDNQKADMVFTDPPYGVKRDKGLGVQQGFRGKGKVIPHRVYEGGWDAETPPKKSFDLMLNNTDKAIIFGGNFFTDKLPQANHWIVWDKKTKMPTFGDAELMWTNIKRNSVSIIEHEYSGLIGREKERYHPTQKPVALLCKVLNDYTDLNETMLDPFSGSGTTLIACEKTKRKCYGMEIDPHYCDVIVKRWEGFTGKKAERVERVEG